MNIDTHIDHIVSLVIEYAPHVLGALLVLVVGMWLIKRVTKLASKAMEKKDLDVSLRTFLRSLVSIGLKIFLIVTVAGMIGIGTTSFVTILGAAGLAVGLALQGSLSNFAGGVLTLVFKPYKVGDTIEVLGQTGTVKEIQVFNTILLTGELKTVILPNGAVSNGTIVNHSKNGTLRAEITVTVSVHNDIDALKGLLLGALLEEPLILSSPGPSVSISRIADGAVCLSLKACGESGNAGTIASRMYELSNAIILAHKIAPAIPQRMVISGN
jgi:small conductance mechanosensitive channel